MNTKRQLLLLVVVLATILAACQIAPGAPLPTPTPPPATVPAPTAVAPATATPCAGPVAVEQMRASAAGTGARLQALAVVDGRLYVAGTDGITEVEQGRAVAATVASGLAPLAIAASPDRLYVATSDGLTVLDAATQHTIVTIPLSDRPLTVAVNPGQGRVYAGTAILDAATNQVVGRLQPQATASKAAITPLLLQVSLTTGRVYALGWNGISGSNSGQVIYVLDGESGAQIATVGGHSTTAFALDTVNQRLYAVATHPISLHSVLKVYATDDLRELASVDLKGTRYEGLAVNPATGHVFLAHAGGASAGTSGLANTLTVLDANTYTVVATLTGGDDPGSLAIVGDRLYALNRGDGSLSVIQDCR
jgi:hypothetical protein